VQWNTRYNLEKYEYVDRIELRITPESNGIVTLLGLAILFVIGSFVWMKSGWLVHWIECIAFAYSIAYEIHLQLSGRQTTISISTNLILAEGYLGSLFRKRVEHHRTGSEKLVFASDAEDEDCILLVHETGRFRILPLVDGKLAGEILEWVFERFPELRSEDNSPASLLHGDDSGILGLGLR